MRRLAPLLVLLACKTDSRFRDAVRAEAYRSWIDLQVCLGGKAPLPTGTAFEERVRAHELGQLDGDDYPDRCAAYQDRLADALDAANLAPAAAEVRELDRWTAEAWDPIAAAIEGAKLEAVDYEPAARGVPAPPPAFEPPLALGTLTPRTKPLDLMPPGLSVPSNIPGRKPPAVEKTGGQITPRCGSETTAAVLAEGLLHIGTSAGWTALPFAQPVDVYKPLACGDGAVEMLYVKEGVEHVACTPKGCVHRQIDLGAKNRLARDAVASAGKVFAILRGDAGGVFLLRGGGTEELAVAKPEPIVDAGDAAVALAPIPDGAVLVIVPAEPGAARYAIRIGADGKVADF